MTMSRQIQTCSSPKTSLSCHSVDICVMCLALWGTMEDASQYLSEVRRVWTWWCVVPLGFHQALVNDDGMIEPSKEANKLKSFLLEQKFNAVMIPHGNVEVDKYGFFRCTVM